MAFKDLELIMRIDKQTTDRMERLRAERIRVDRETTLFYEACRRFLIRFDPIQVGQNAPAAAARVLFAVLSGQPQRVSIDERWSELIGSDGIKYPSPVFGPAVGYLRAPAPEHAMRLVRVLGELAEDEAARMKFDADVERELFRLERTVDGEADTLTGGIEGQTLRQQARANVRLLNAITAHPTEPVTKGCINCGRFVHARPEPDPWLCELCADDGWTLLRVVESPGVTSYLPQSDLPEPHEATDSEHPSRGTPLCPSCNLPAMRMDPLTGTCTICVEER